MKKQILKTKKAQFVEIDFFLAILILGMGIIVITAPFINVREDIQADRLSYDAVTILSTMKLQGLEQETRNGIIIKASNLGIEFNDEDTINHIIIKLIVEAQKGANKNDLMKLARYITNETLKDIIPERYKYEVTIISGDETYNLIDIEEKTSLASQSRTLLTGLQVGKPITGYIANANLKEIKKTDAVYEFIGGFIGQGDISFTIDLPNIPAQNIKNLYIEGLFKENFLIYVNKNLCAEMSEGFVNQSLNCVQYLQSDLNKISINFSGDDLNEKYVSGGLIKIEYDVIQTISANPRTITKRKYIPDITGIINMYDSIYVPGKLINVSINLNHEMDILFNSLDDSSSTDVQLIMTIGNETVYESKELGFVSYQNKLNLEYDYEDETIPFRVGFPNLTASFKGGEVDIIIITDLSGSMNRMLINSSSGITRNNCDDPDLYNETTRRISVAKCLIKDFINKTLENTDNRIALINFAANAVIYEQYTNDSAYLIQRVNDMKVEGGTCISCATAAALNISFIDEEREKIVILMTDGEANRKYINDYPIITAPYTGESNTRRISEAHSETFTDIIKSNKHTIYSIAFALNSDNGKNFLKRSSSGEDYFFEGNSGEALSAAYDSIATQIIGLGYVAQIVEITADSFEKFNTKLINSYIEYTYEPALDSSFTGKIKVTKDYELTEDCNQNVELEIGRAIIGGGYITSYSGKIWTVMVEINNAKIFDVLKYIQPLGKLGDPFMIGIKPGIIIQNSHINLLLDEGEGRIQDICNKNNKLIYDLYYPATFSISDVSEKSEGCNWNVGGKTIKIPSNYAGSNTCVLDNYDSNDVMQVLGYEIITALTHEGKLVIDLENSELEVSVAQIDNIPYMWGPAIIGVTLWR
jgi:hypothetical protein